MIKSGNNLTSIIPTALNQLILGRNSFASPKQKKSTSSLDSILGAFAPRQPFLYNTTRIVRNLNNLIL
jgi:hypothetical protein